jgi:PAS domain S-box-containing protein
MSSESPRQEVPFRLIILFLILAIGIGTSGFLFYKQQRISLRKEVINNIASIADLKTRQIAAWRQERLGDAETISRNPLIIHHLREWLKSGSPETKEEILIWMKLLRERNLYKSISFLDLRGDVRLALSDGNEALGQEAKRLAREALASKKIIFSRLYRSNITNDIRLTLATPLLVSRGHDYIPVGVLLLRVDPYQLLYPLIQSWPTQSKTAETYLVRKEVNDVLFLNELRHRKDTALNFRIPLKEKDDLAVMAVSRQPGIVEAKDYRGIAVLASIRSIPDSPWIIVSKIDKKEVFAALEQNAVLISITVFILILASGLFVLLMWKHRAAESFKKQYETERERKIFAERYEHLTKHANDIILLSERNGKIFDANERAVDMYGYTHGEMLRLDLHDLRSAETKALLYGELKAVEKLNGMIYETQHQRKDGTVFPVEESSRIIDIDGNQYVQSIIRNITERKKTEKRIMNLNRTLTVLSDINQTIVRVREPQILFETACKIAVEKGGFLLAWIGLVDDTSQIFKPVASAGKSNEYLEKISIALMGEPKSYCPIDNALRIGEHSICNFIEQKENLDTCQKIASDLGFRSCVSFPLKVFGIIRGTINFYADEPNFFSEDEIKLLDEMAMDISFAMEFAEKEAERSRAEDEKENLYAQLVQAQKMEAVGQLAGGIAHDFNNILTAMIGYGHMLKINLKENDTLSTYADYILTLSDKAAYLTQSLLTFSRKHTMNPKATDLNEIIRNVAKLLFRVIGENIQLRTVLSEGDLIIKADHVQIEQVLMNLATNAKDAMPGGGFLTIETETIYIDHEFIREHGYGKEATYALMSVADTGMGMDKTTRAKIFEPFFTTKEVGKGTGLGLAMVYGIIKQHDGYINVYSEPGKGTTFRIYLPLIEATADAGKETPVVIQTLETGTETILLAEDETEVRIFNKQLLSEYGYNVIDAVDGQEAIDKFYINKDEIQLVILDVIMPKKSGREAYEEIKKVTPDVNVLFTSGYTADIIHKHGIIEDGLAYIDKPASPTKFLRIIREVLDKNQK